MKYLCCIEAPTAYWCPEVRPKLLNCTLNCTLTTQSLSGYKCSCLPMPGIIRNFIYIGVLLLTLKSVLQPQLYTFPSIARCLKSWCSFDPSISFFAAAGEYYNYSGCGNTLNTNHPVVARMIVDCLRHWVTAYHVDGFRFDLASILTRAPSTWHPDARQAHSQDGEEAGEEEAGGEEGAEGAEVLGHMDCWKHGCVRNAARCQTSMIPGRRGGSTHRLLLYKLCNIVVWASLS